MALLSEIITYLPISLFYLFPSLIPLLYLCWYGYTENDKLFSFLGLILSLVSSIIYVNWFAKSFFRLANSLHYQLTLPLVAFSLIGLSLTFGVSIIKFLWEKEK
jgi:hypothetical protein